MAARQLTLPGCGSRSEHTPVLVCLSTATAKLRFTRQTITEMRECGELRWVWDVSVRRADIMEVRFWYQELEMVRVGDFSAVKLSPDFVIQSIIGHDTQALLRSTTVCETLDVQHPTLMEYHRAGELDGDVVNGVRMTTRDSLVRFLARRLLS